MALWFCLSTDIVVYRIYSLSSKVSSLNILICHSSFSFPFCSVTGFCISRFEREKKISASIGDEGDGDGDDLHSSPLRWSWKIKNRFFSSSKRGGATCWSRWTPERFQKNVSGGFKFDLPWTISLFRWQPSRKISAGITLSLIIKKLLAYACIRML